MERQRRSSFLLGVSFEVVSMEGFGEDCEYNVKDVPLFFWHPKRKEGRLHRLPLFDLVRLMRIRVTELIGVSMRIIRDVRPMTPVCNANVGIKICNSKLFPNFMHV